MTLWLPTDLGSKLVAWIDPTDGTKVTSSGGAISQITDKSSNGFNATQATGAAQPATATDPDGSGLTVISNAVGNGLGLSSSILSGKTKASVYAMGRRTNPSGNGEYSQGPLIGNLTDTGHQSFHWPYAGTIYDGFCSTSRKTVGTFPSYAAWHIFSVHSEASLYEFRIDTGDGAGGSSAFYTDTGNTFNAGSAGTPYIGADTTPGASTYSWLGYIGPVVLTDGTETSGERAQIEGYLAWHMGQQAVLPSGHAYKSAAPTTGSSGNTGTLAATEATDVAASTGNLAAYGTLAATEAKDTAAITGLVAAFGTLAATEAIDTAAITGALSVSGTLAATEAKDTAALSGNLSAYGTLAATEAVDTAAAAGSVVSGISGMLTSTEAQDAASLAGNLAALGTLAATEARDIAALTGTSVAALTGTLAGIEAADIAALMGSSGPWWTLGGVPASKSWAAGSAASNPGWNSPS